MLCAFNKVLHICQFEYLINVLYPITLINVSDLRVLWEFGEQKFHAQVCLGTERW